MKIKYGCIQPEDYIETHNECFIEQLHFKLSKLVNFFTYSSRESICPTSDTVAIFKVKPKH